MSAGAAPMTAAVAARLLRARLATRLDEDDLDWLDDHRSLGQQGVDSVDLISALAAAQLHDGVVVPDDLVITRQITLAALGEALARGGRAGAGP